MGIGNIKQPFNHQQIEMLNLFQKEMDEEDYLAIKRLIVKRLAKKLAQLSDKLWEEKGWTNETIDNLLNTHERTTYPKK
jgi:hypothetical protein